jgi:two-component system, sensor histidine kinase FlrB
MTTDNERNYSKHKPGLVAMEAGDDLSCAEIGATTATESTATARYQRLLMVLPGGVVVLDGDGRIQECNPAAIDMLGSPLLGCLWREVVKRSFDPKSDDGHDISLRNDRRVNISTQALTGEAGQILLLKDVTETRQLQDEVGRHKRLAAMGEMAASLAHQIRTPLSAAILYLSNLASNQSLVLGTRQRFAEKSLARLRHLEQLVNHMLLYARAGTFDMEEVSVRDLLDELQRQNDQRTRAGTLELETDTDAIGATVVRANRTALLSVLLNLVDNAVQVTTGVCRMRVSASVSSEAMVHLVFADNGPGVPTELRSSLFEPFVTTRPDGNGLGLAVAQAVVRAHRGTIALETVAPQSARFCITLPALSIARGKAASLPLTTANALAVS